MRVRAQTRYEFANCDFNDDSASTTALPEENQWEQLYEKHRELFGKAATKRLSDSERAELFAILAEFHKPTPPDSARGK